MSGERAQRLALIVATGRYDDLKLARLRGPAADAERLAKVLANPDIGNFEVQVAQDEDGRALMLQLARIFSGRRPDDLVLVHFSCHGIKDDRGRLYLATTDTQLEYPHATAISAEWLNEQINYTRARRTLLLLDCCFAGRFPFGMARRSGEELGVGDQLGGQGRAVISASNAMEYAYEGDQLTESATGSVFTTVLVEGLETGEADQDRDKWVSVDELYGYVYERVKAENPAQTPTRQGALEGDFYVARSVFEPPVEPAKLDERLLELLNHPVAGARLGAVEELEPLLASTNRSVALAADNALQALASDDSRRVAARAAAALGRFPRGDEESSATPHEDPSIAARALDDVQPNADDELADRLSNLATSQGWSSYSDTVRVFSKDCRPDEQPYWVFHASPPGKFLRSAIVLVTNQRLIWRRFAGATSSELNPDGDPSVIELSSVTDAQASGKLVFGSLSLRHAGRVDVFKSDKAKQLTHVAEFINRQAGRGP